MTHSAIRLKGLSKSFIGPPIVQVLTRIDLEVDYGEMLAITGPSGSGKSTLLNILGMLDVPSSGNYELAGQNVGSMSGRARTALRSATIGFVFQSYHLVGHLDLVDNVALPLLHLGVPTKIRREQAEVALGEVGLSHRAHAKPATLSGGELQRAAIARSVIHEPAIVLCDEPTGNLDSANTELVLTRLRNIVSPSRTVVVVTHDPVVARQADREIGVVDGHIA
jgi:putative ABC transport system ATP-binding protein